MYTQKKVGNLTFTKFSGYSLPEFVKDIVEVRGHAVETTQRLYPRNTPEILINLAKPIKGDVGSKTAVIERCTIQGSKTEHVNAWHPRNCHFLSIRFTPNGYYKFMGIPQKSFTDQVLKLEDIIDGDLGSLILTLQEAPKERKRFQILTRWLKKADRKTGGDTLLVSDFIIKYLNRDPQLSVRQLTGKTGFTRKHLAQRFREEAGLTIKEYQKINRIYRLLKEIKQSSSISWAQLACKFGFYDQSHLIRDFKQYTGLTPAVYLQQEILPQSRAS